MSKYQPPPGPSNLVFLLAAGLLSLSTLLSGLLVSRSGITTINYIQEQNEKAAREGFIVPRSGKDA